MTATEHRDVPPAACGVAGRLGRPWRGIAHWLQGSLADWRDRRSLSRELADLRARGELDAVLAEIGLSRAQIPQLIAGGPAGARLLGQMLDRLGIERRHIASGAALQDLAWTCTACTERRTCRAWLASGRTEGFQDFCPNAAVLECLRKRSAPTAE